MSAKQRKEEQARRDEARFRMDAMSAARALMDTPQGQAFAWLTLRDNLRAEGPASKGRRMLAWDMLDALVIANREGTIQMLERYYQPRLGTHAEEEEGGGEE